MKEFKTRPSQKLHFMMTINGPHNKRSLVMINTKPSLKSSLKHNSLVVYRHKTKVDILTWWIILQDSEWACMYHQL